MKIIDQPGNAQAKICKKCGQTFSSRECKPCRNEYARIWCRQNKDKVKANASASYLRNQEKEKARVKAWREQNHEKDRATKEEWRRANPEKLRFYARNARAKAPELFKSRAKAWRQKNPEKVRLMVVNRRARIRQDGGALSKDIAQRLMSAQRARCAACVVSLKLSGYHLDHIVPVSAGGRNVDSNIQLLCPSCNHSKGAKDPVAFMQSKGYLL